jgi:hypothetical protein
VLGHENIPVNMLDKYSNNNDPDIRKAVASNEITPSLILKKLSLDKVEMVRFSVYLNPSTSKSTLNKLKKDNFDFD